MFLGLKSIRIWIDGIERATARGTNVKVISWCCFLFSGNGKSRISCGIRAMYSLQLTQKIVLVVFLRVLNAAVEVEIRFVYCTRCKLQNSCANARRERRTRSSSESTWYAIRFNDGNKLKRAIQFDSLGNRLHPIKLAEQRLCVISFKFSVKRVDHSSLEWTHG